jgi:hypothetical protein
MDWQYNLCSFVGNLANDGAKLYGAYLIANGEPLKGIACIGTSLTLDVLMVAGIVPENVEERNIYDKVKFGLYRETFGRIDDYLSTLDFHNRGQ